MLALLSIVRKGFLGKLLHTNKDITHTQHLIKNNPDSLLIVIDEVIENSCLTLSISGSMFRPIKFVYHVYLTYYWYLRNRFRLSRTKKDIIQASSSIMCTWLIIDIWGTGLGWAGPRKTSFNQVLLSCVPDLLLIFVEQV